MTEVVENGPISHDKEGARELISSNSVDSSQEPRQTSTSDTLSWLHPVSLIKMSGTCSFPQFKPSNHAADDDDMMSIHRGATDG